MANELRTKFISKASFTITLASLANNAARQSTLISNSSNYPAAKIQLRIQSGTAPTAGAVYEVYLLQGNGGTPLRTDNAGASDAAITIENARLLKAVYVTATANKNFFIEIDTFADTGGVVLGTEWGIAVLNLSGQALNSTEGNHIKEYEYYVPELQ